MDTEGEFSIENGQLVVKGGRPLSAAESRILHELNEKMASEARRLPAAFIPRCTGVACRLSSIKAIA